MSASDIHLLPTAVGLEVRYRIDGVLQLAGTLPRSLLSNVVARLKLLANMITYRTDIPQEGRILESGGDAREAGKHVPHALRGEGRHPDVWWNEPVPAAGATRVARTDPTRPCRGS